MNASETIQAAIDKLESQRRASRREPEDWHLDLHDDETGALLLTLHRTIDAQLAILRCALPEAEWEDDWTRGMTEETTLAITLARSILGEAS